MSTRTRKRRSTIKSYETRTPKPKETFLVPRDRFLQRVLRTPTPASISQKRQETLTQIGFVVYQVPEDMELNYEEDVNRDEEETPRVRKRRKISKGLPEPVTRKTRSSARHAAKTTIADENGEGSLKLNVDENVTRKTRSSARHAAETTIADENGKESLKLSVDESRIQLEEASKALMPPPKTPQPTRRREVPSSQSPADTPLSIRSRKSQRDLSRSPLKERSTNVRTIEDPSARKSVCWSPILEVADSNSSDHEREESQPTVPASETTSSNPTKCEMTIDSAHSSSTDPTLPTDEVEVPASSQQKSLDGDVQGTSTPRYLNIKSVSDSETEEEDDDNFGINIETQAALEGVDTQLYSSNSTEQSIPITDMSSRRKVTNDAEPAPSKQNDCHSEHSQINVGREPDSIDQSSHLRLSNHPETPQHPKQSTAPSSANSVLRSESEDISFQRAHVLNLHAQICTSPETGTQFENAWREYKPAPLSDDDRGPSESGETCLSNVTPRALESEVLERDLPSANPLLPILPPCTASPSSSHPPQQAPPSPAANLPSETTTDETTQSSPSHISSQRLQSSSPPRPPSSLPFSSLTPRSRAARYAEDWDGVPLTDSQLLPDSLMNGTLVGPPSLVGSDWESEEDEPS